MSLNHSCYFCLIISITSGNVTSHFSRRWAILGLSLLFIRVGDHSTSDDSTVYRLKDEVKMIAAEDNPINRLRLFMEDKGWWSNEMEAEWRLNARKMVSICYKADEDMTDASTETKPCLSS